MLLNRFVGESSDCGWVFLHRTSRRRRTGSPNFRPKHLARSSALFVPRRNRRIQYIGTGTIISASSPANSLNRFSPRSRPIARVKFSCCGCFMRNNHIAKIAVIPSYSYNPIEQQRGMFAQGTMVRRFPVSENRSPAMPAADPLFRNQSAATCRTNQGMVFRFRNINPAICTSRRKQQIQPARRNIYQRIPNSPNQSLHKSICVS